MNRDDLLKNKREEILRIAARHGAQNVRIFGSVARGESGPNSDVDFLVEMEPHRSLLDLSRLIIDLQENLGCKVDVAEPESLHWYIRETVLKEAILL
jgi:uncharacterized protein